MPPEPEVKVAEVDNLPPPDPNEPAGGQDLADLRQQVTDLEARLKAPPASVPNQPPTKEELNKQFYEDPTGNVQAASLAAAQHTVTQVVGPAFDTLKDVARGQARGEGTDAKFFDKFEGEITELVNTLPEHVRVSSTAWQNATTAIRGKHVDDYIELKGAAPSTSKPPGAPPAAPSTPAAPAAKPAELTQDENTVTTFMAVSPDEYNKAKEENNDQPKAWGDIFTLNSKRPSSRNVRRPKA